MIGRSTLNLLIVIVFLVVKCAYSCFLGRGIDCGQNHNPSWINIPLKYQHQQRHSYYSYTYRKHFSNRGDETIRKALSKDELLRLTQEYLDNPSPDYWADDFVLRGPVIGPLVKQDLIQTLTSVAPEQDAFPDFEANVFGLTADDPIEPNRVWYFIRPRGTFTGTFQHPTLGTIEGTGKALIAPPEARSVVWNDDGKIQYQSVGYVTDRFTGDTTDGQGAVFGLYAHMGAKMDATPGSPITRFLQWLATILPEEMGIPRSYSREDDIPIWWIDPRRGADA